MWRRIELRNYRSIEYASVELPRFTVLVGPNSSGKSSFADAFVFARDIGIDARTAVDQRGGIGELRRSSRTRPTDLSVGIRVSRTRAGLESNYAEHEFTIGSLRGGDWKFKQERLCVTENGKTRFQLSREDDELEFHGSLARRFSGLLS